MALPPSPAAAIRRESASPHPPRSPGIPRPRRSDHHTGHSSQGPGRAQPNPGPLARLLLFPLFLPPPSPIRIVCLNSTLTNMDSSSLGRAVITAPPHREPDSPRHLHRVQRGSFVEAEGGDEGVEGAVRFPVHISLAPAAPGPRDQKFAPEGA